MTGDLSNVRIGVVEVFVNGVSVGHSKGGCEISYKAEYTDLTVDQFGDTPIDKALKSESFSAKLALAEITAANLKKAIPTGTLTTAGGRNKLTIGRSAGYKLINTAAQIVLHPIRNAANYLEEDITIYKGVIISEAKLAKKFDEQEVIEIEIMALIDQSRSDGNYLATIGDTTVA